MESPGVAVKHGRIAMSHLNFLPSFLFLPPYISALFGPSLCTTTLCWFGQTPPYKEEIPLIKRDGSEQTVNSGYRLQGTLSHQGFHENKKKKL